METRERNALYLLGTGTPTPTKSRFGTAYVLQIGRTFLLFDCGPATTLKLVRADLWPTQIEYLFLTHHHFDHNADLPCFLLCRWDQSIGKEHVLKVFGPPPTTRIIERLVGPNGAFSDDLKARVGAPTSQSVHANRGGALPRPELELNVNDVSPGDVIEGANWKLTTAQVHHVEPWLQSLAYRIDTDEGSIVFAGDTGPCPQLLDLAGGADVFVANCWNHQEIMDADGEAPGQTGTLDAARFAAESGAGTLVLAHTGPSLCTPGLREKAIGQMAAHYAGEIIFGEEGMVLDLWRHGSKTGVAEPEN